MEKQKTSVRYSPEVRTRAVRMVLEHAGDHASQWAAIGSIAAKIGCTAETLRGWVRQAERDQGQRPGPTSEERARVKKPEREKRARRGRAARGAGQRIPGAGRRRIFPGRTSTADTSHDRIHRRSPRGVWGRADLRSAADRPIDLSQPCRQTGRSVALAR